MIACGSVTHIKLSTQRKRASNAVVATMVYEHKVEGLVICSEK